MVHHRGRAVYRIGRPENMVEAMESFHKFNGNTPEDFFEWLRWLYRDQLARTAGKYRGTAKRQVKEIPLDSHHVIPGIQRKLVANTPTPVEDAIAREELQLLKERISGLTEKGRRFLQLRFDEELPFQEISKPLGISVQTAQMRCTLAVRHLSQAQR